ncbi:M48 family metallopeptidase [Sandaracinobacter neustonicus]|uniref:M48 family metallopeptidase n=1 Tax=Sandaracinobacter neustonicus TaxID=1715348 RepID=UPI0015E3373E|nr:M48 family metallopeptidase [Sandaracinobacter neustonicus]
MPTPSPSAGSEAAAWLFDGETATRHLVQISPWAGGLQLSGDVDALLARRELRQLTSGARRTVLGHVQNPDWRLIAEPPLPPAWLAGIPSNADMQPRDLRLTAMAATGIAAAAAGLWLWGGLLLAQTAPLLPDAVAEPLGRDMVRQIVGNRRCDSAEASAALSRLAARLTPPDDAPMPLTITLADWPLANAFAGPGGQIVLTRGLIDAASGPDELAGVLAHEMGHVAHHHPTRALLRVHGFSLLAGTIAGDGGHLADLGLMLAATRDGEREADSFALTALATAGISSAGLEAFFERQLSTQPPPTRLSGLGDWASTHPADAERLATIRAGGVRAGSPAMGAADWAAVRGACAGGADQAGR